MESNTAIIEIRAAEGGEDAKLLVDNLIRAYANAALRRGFECELLDKRHGFVVMSVTGAGAMSSFASEAGGHRWQRVPPTEKRGRVHTSTVTVAVFDPDRFSSGKQIDPRDIEITTTRGSGPGGQHRNKVESCVVAKHKPTGIQVRIDLRSQHQSRTAALRVLAAKVHQHETDLVRTMQDAARREQVGSGMRGDKVRTYREQDDQVVDHRSGQKWSLKRWMKGEW